MVNIYQGIDFYFDAEGCASSYIAKLRNEDLSFVSQAETIVLSNNDIQFRWSGTVTSEFPLDNLTLEIYNQNKTLIYVIQNFACVRESTAKEVKNG